MTGLRAQLRKPANDETQQTQHSSKSTERVTEVEDHEPKRRIWMNIKEQQDIFLRYPLFFRAVGCPNSYPSNIAHFGLQCGPGWYPLVAELAQDIEDELRSLWHEQLQFPKNLAEMDKALLRGHGQYPAIPVCIEISRVAGELVVVLLDGHVSNFGAWLRIRMSIDEAVAKAHRTCEVCGNPGQYRETFWRYVYCDDCMPSTELFPVISSQLKHL